MIAECHVTRIEFIHQFQQKHAGYAPQPNTHTLAQPGQFLHSTTTKHSAFPFRFPMHRSSVGPTIVHSTTRLELPPQRHALALCAIMSPILYQRRPPFLFLGRQQRNEGWVPCPLPFSLFLPQLSLHIFPSLFLDSPIPPRLSPFWLPLLFSSSFLFPLFKISPCPTQTGLPSSLFFPRRLLSLPVPRAPFPLPLPPVTTS